MSNHFRCNTCGRVYEGLTTEALDHAIECHARATARQDRERERWRERYNAYRRAWYWKKVASDPAFRANNNARHRAYRERESA